MKPCDECSWSYPDPLVNPMAMGVKDKGWKLQYFQLCPICALDVRNTLAGLPPGTPFQGGIAQQLYDMAIDYRHHRNN